MKKLNFVSRTLAFFHSLMLLGSLLMPFGAYYGRAKGNEAVEIARIFSLTILLFIPAVAGYFIAKKLKNIYLYLGIGIGISMLVNKAAAYYIRSFDIPDSGEAGYIAGICFVLSMFIFLVYVKSYVKRTEDEWGENIRPGQTADGEVAVGITEGKNFFNWPDIRHSILLIVHYITAVYLNLDIYVKWIFVLLVCDVILIFLNKSCRCLLDFFYKYRHTGSMPVQAITKTVLGYMVVGIVFIAIALIPSLIMGHEPLLGYNRNTRVNYVSGPAKADVGEQGGGTEPTREELEQIALDYDAYLPAWVGKLLRAIIIIIVLLSALVIGGTILGYIRESSRAFKTRSKDEDEIEYLDGGLLDKKTLTRVWSMAKEDIFNPGAQIRNLYKKLIKKNTKGAPAMAGTPHELEQEASVLDMACATELHALYEKARYSQYESTAEEAKLMKSFVLKGK